VSTTSIVDLDLDQVPQLRDGALVLASEAPFSELPHATLCLMGVVHDFDDARSVSQCKRLEETGGDGLNLIGKRDSDQFTGHVGTRDTVDSTPDKGASCFGVDELDLGDRYLVVVLEAIDGTAPDKAGNLASSQEWR